MTVQPMRGNPAINAATPTRGTKIMRVVIARIRIPTIQGFRQRRHELKKLFISALMRT